MPLPVERRWKLVPQFLLRRAGFPLNLLEAVRYREVAQQAQVAAAAESRAAGLRTRLLRQELPQEVRRLAQAGERAALRRLGAYRSRLGRQGQAPFPAGPYAPGLQQAAAAHQAAREELGAALAKLNAALPGELYQARATLLELFRRPQMREALFLLSTDLVETMTAALDAQAPRSSTSSDRALERRLYSFLQRLASKNETTSFFGPMAYGEVDPTVGATRFGPETATGTSRRETFTAFWAAAAFGKAAAAIPAIRRALPVRRVAVTRWDPEGALTPEGKRLPLTPLQQQVYALAGAALTSPQLAARLGLPAPEVEAAVVSLERALLVRRDLEPLSTTSYPLASVQAGLPDLPQARAVGEQMEAFQAVLRRFTEADLPGRQRLLREAEEIFAQATGQPARRAAGQTYADRAVLYEDCLGDLQPVRLAGDEARRLEQEISPLLELGAGYGALRAEALRSLATEVLAGLREQVPFLEFAAALDARIAGGALRERDRAAAQLLSRLEELVRQRSDGRVARLTFADLQPLLPPAGQGRFASPDVMIQVEGGRTRFVIGEVHPYVFAWGSQGHFTPHPERFFAAFREDLSPWGGPGRLATVLRRRRHKGLLSDAFPGTFIEVTGRASVDPERCVAIADLVVRAGAQGPELWGPHGPLTLYVGEDDHPHLRTFAPPGVEIPPVRLEGHTPRIEVGDFVLQRERWQLSDSVADPSLLAAVEKIRSARGPAELAVAVAGARARLGWPPVVFALSRTEPKPLCLDLDVPFAQQMLQRLLGLGPVTLSEMMPSPDGLWVRRSAGTHTSELRMALIRDPAAS